MKKFVETLKNIWNTDELRKRILYTLGLILVYRVASFIVLPGIDQKQMTINSSGANGLTDILDLFAGGAFSKASVMALGIMPYISASIIMQLLGMAVPAVQKMQKEGESGRRKINSYTRFLTIAICAFQGPAYLKMYVPNTAILDDGYMWWGMAMLTLIAGTMFAMWLGERITDNGIGNGVSLLITVGILARFPGAVLEEFISSDSSIFFNIIKVVIFFAILMVTVLIVQGVRRLPVNYAKRMAGGAVTEQSARSYIPLKVNASGVMPIIFAQAIMSIPMMVFSTEGVTNSFVVGLVNPFSWQYNLVFGLLIIVFTYFYTAITVNPKQIADDLKRNGGFIPGVKPGTDTAERIDDIVSKITLPGSIFLAFIAIIPALAHLAGFKNNFAMFMGGTSILIMVGVVLDTLQQIETYLMNQHYDGLMEGGRIKGRRGANEMSNVI